MPGLPGHRVLPPVPPADQVRRDGWLRVMGWPDIEAVLALEQRANPFPWTRGNLLDSLASGYPAWVLESGEPGQVRCLGYYVAMMGVEEMHLLNIAVDPAQQGRGLARRMLAHLAGLCRTAAAPVLWLEVRESNTRARRLYEQWGFERMGLRRNYYPAAQGQREHALVMRWSVTPSGACDALD